MFKINFVDPVGLKGFTASHLIPLDKNPGVRLIGVTEVCRHILGKAVMQLIKLDLQESIGKQQFCNSLDSGCEAAFHCTYQSSLR